VSSEDRESRRHPSNPDKAKRLPPGQSITYKWPVLHAGDVPAIDLATWRLRVFGAVEHEASFSWSEFLALPQSRFHSDMHCVTRWTRLDNDWEGVATREVLSRVGVVPEARFVMVRSYGGYATNLPLADFAAPDSILAHRHDGEPLAPEHGWPMRLVVPHLYLWKSAKWVESVELLTRDAPGFWEENGYHMRGDPWREQRYR
jgi:DMSO/TMAO reductase YedYZ molybdopterin-dependent catalytic subunit